MPTLTVQTVFGPLNFNKYENTCGFPYVHATFLIGIKSTRILWNVIWEQSIQLCPPIICISKPLDIFERWKPGVVVSQLTFMGFQLYCEHLTSSMLIRKSHACKLNIVMNPARACQTYCHFECYLLHGCGIGASGQNQMNQLRKHLQVGHSPHNLNVPEVSLKEKSMALVKLAKEWMRWMLNYLISRRLFIRLAWWLAIRGQLASQHVFGQITDQGPSTFETRSQDLGTVHQTLCHLGFLQLPLREAY